jgi:hypothetical protein
VPVWTKPGVAQKPAPTWGGWRGDLLELLRAGLEQLLRGDLLGLLRAGLEQLLRGDLLGLLRAGLGDLSRAESEDFS